MKIKQCCRTPTVYHLLTVNPSVRQFPANPGAASRGREKTYLTSGRPEMLSLRAKITMKVEV